MPIEVESPEQLGYGKIRNNLAESSYADAVLRDFSTGDELGDLLLCYGSHRGHEGLRGLIAAGGAGDTERTPTGLSGPAGPIGKDDILLGKDDILLTSGAAGALFIIATTLLEKGDEIVVVHPNYATNLETPRAIGAAIRTIDLRFEEDFTLDIDKVSAMLTPNTKYVSITHPHNPTGVCLQESQLQGLARLAEATGVRILVDETYRDMVFGRQLPLAATYSPLLISISSISKTYGLPGLRTGWIVCRDQELLETFLAAKEQMQICGPILDEELAYRYLLHRDRHLSLIRSSIAEKFALVKAWMQDQDDYEWVQPQGGCVCFPRMRDPEKTDPDKFYRILLESYGTYVGPGHWFEMPRHYLRIGFGWPSPRQLADGLHGLSNAIRDTH